MCYKMCKASASNGRNACHTVSTVQYRYTQYRTYVFFKTSMNRKYTEQMTYNSLHVGEYRTNLPVADT
jgi:hypothetical protein